MRRPDTPWMDEAGRMAASMSVVVNVSRSSWRPMRRLRTVATVPLQLPAVAAGMWHRQALHGRVVRRAVRHRGSRHSLCVLGEGPGPTLRVVWPLRVEILMPPFLYYDPTSWL